MKRVVAFGLSALFALLFGGQQGLAQEAQPSVATSSDASSDSVLTATDREARAVFMAAEVAFEEGRFQSAVEYFLQSFRLSGRPELLYNIGNTYDRLQKPEEALEYFDQYLRQRPNAENNKQVEARTRLLRQAVDERRIFADGAAPHAAPTPEQTAQAHVAATEAPGPTQAPPAATAPTAESDSSWILWGSVAVAVMTATVVTVLVATHSTTTQDPLLPSSDVPVRRL